MFVCAILYKILSVTSSLPKRKLTQTCKLQIMIKLNTLN